MTRAANDGEEPRGDLSDFCCERMQHENRCKGAVIDAVSRRRNRPFGSCAAAINLAIYRSRDSAAVDLL